LVRVKICGITSVEDALSACDAGADGLGLVFWQKSPRFVDTGRAKAIVGSLPPFIKTVGVFVDEEMDTILETIGKVGLDAVQLHGSEPPEFCRGINRSIIKAFRVKDEGITEELSRYHVSAYLLDTYQEGVPGGTGDVFNWDLAIKAKEYGRIILAGGLTPENVKDAVERVRPYGVDVSSGVEESAGKKDFNKVRRFIEMAKGVYEG
jgi:phosphoribosylanthranilate isomerase